MKESQVPGRIFYNRNDGTNQVAVSETKEAVDKFEASMYEAVKQYIKACYPELSEQTLIDAAAMTYQYWDDTRYFIPIAVKQSKEDHTCDKCGRHLENDPCDCEKTT